MMFRRPLTFVLLAAITLAPSAAEARVRLENICSIYGQHETQLVGLGLVVGLPGTGDGPKSAPTMRALGAALGLLRNPVSRADLDQSKNVAIVMISATVPKDGLRRGQKLDCRVATLMGATNLRGGRLVATPLEVQDLGGTDGAAGDEVYAVGVAAGEVTLDAASTPTSGRVYNGVQLSRDFVTPFFDQRGVVTLLLDESHSSFHSASEVARVVNAEFSFEARSRNVAKAVGEGAIEVMILDQYRDDPVEFIASLLDVTIEQPHTQARVVVNPRTKTVVVTGEVEISPVVIAHEGLTINVGNVPAADAPSTIPGFVSVANDGDPQSPQQLDDLVNALNGLKVPTEDVIDILRILHDSGKLHAEFVEN